MVSSKVITGFAKGADQDVGGSAETHHVSIHAQGCELA